MVAASTVTAIRARRVQRRARDHDVRAERQLGLDRRGADLATVDAHDRTGGIRGEPQLLARRRRAAYRVDERDRVRRELGERHRPVGVERERDRDRGARVVVVALLVQHDAEPQ